MSTLELQRLPVVDVAIKDPRQGRRFSSNLPCCCVSPSSGLVRLAGRTCNMSRTGVLARFIKPGASEVRLRVGETALLEIDLPTSPGSSPAFLHCMATVARILDLDTDHLTVAFELRSFRLVESHEKASVHTGSDFQTPAGPGRVQ